ncbi:MAG: antibiotic biosynthesis monooxygenase [Bifidobacteriaceae bacterium]|jgi:quinol monooxygenase YgiN|nr:antibiotic biosynthesis monooxygenase [Bifidobacteriaceae bacterium]
MADPVVIVATFFPREGLHDSVHAIIAAAQTDVYQEPGCLLYALHEAPDRFVLIEKWASQADLDAHGQSKALAKLGEDLAPLVAAETEVIYLQQVPHGSKHPASEAKGADA